MKLTEKKKRYKNIKQVWADLDKGKPIYWKHDGYIVVIENVTKGCDFQENHFTRDGNKMLSIRYAANWFGGLMEKSEIRSLYSVSRPKKEINQLKKGSKS